MILNEDALEVLRRLSASETDELSDLARMVNVTADEFEKFLNDIELSEDLDAISLLRALPQRKEHQFPV